jgi:hypothetical protein
MLGAILRFSSAQIMFHPYEFQLYGGGGISDVYTHILSTKHSVGRGYQTGVAMQFWFTKMLGINVGGEYAAYNNSSTLSENLVISNPGWHDDWFYNANHVKELRSEYNLSTVLYNYKEKLTIGTVNIPIAITLQTLGAYKYYFNFGMKIGFPIKSLTSYKVLESDMINSAYYPEIGTTLTYIPDYLLQNGQEQFVEHHSGYGKFENHISQGNVDFGISYSLYFETGMKFEINRVKLYFGAYFDYGLNDIRKGEDNLDFINHEEGYKIGQHFTTNPLLYSNKSPGVPLTDKVFPLSFGGKLRISYGFGEKKQHRARYVQSSRVY